MNRTSSNEAIKLLNLPNATIISHSLNQYAQCIFKLYSLNEVGQVDSFEN